MGALADLWNYLTEADNWWGTTGILKLTWAHIYLSGVALLISSALALPAAIGLAHQRKGSLAATSIVNVGRALPSFAIIALALPFSLRWGFGLGFWPTCVALVALGVPPIFTNAYTAIVGVPAASLEAARGVGMTEAEVLRQVEVPAALPLILTGIRVSAVQIVATATLGALVGYRCLGSLIVIGLAQGKAGTDKLIAGAALVALLSVATDLFFGRLEKAATPWRRASRPAAEAASTT
jgi:osmoprotectant transport system permease protein